MLGQIIGAGLGMATANWQDKRQLRQQEKLQNLGIEGSKEMGRFNQGLALDMWERTNYEAQRRQMQKAGLNVGLMYGGGGAGGGTTNTPTGNVGTGSATGGSGEIGMGIQMGLQTQMVQAQIEATKAQTEKTKVETAKAAGVDTEAVMAGIQNLLQSTTNAKLQNEIMKFDKGLKELELRKGTLTEEEYYKQVKALTEKLIGEAQSAQVKGEIDEKTKDEVIKGAQLANKATEAEIAGTKAGTKLTQAKTAESELDQVFKGMENELRANGINSNDHPALRMISRAMSNAKVSMKEAQQAIKDWINDKRNKSEEEAGDFIKWLYKNRPSEWFK